MSVEATITKKDMWFRDEDKVLEFTVTSDGVTPVDISTWTLQFDLCTKAFATVFTKTTASGITITDGPNGVLQVAVDSTDTSGQNPGSYRYELRRTNVGAEATLAHGEVALQRGCV